VTERDREGSPGRLLLTFGLVFALLVLGLFMLLVGGAACLENVRPGSRRAQVCEVVGGDGANPTFWIMLGAPALLLLVGRAARRNLTVVLGWLLLAAVEITLIVLAILVAA
jgi:hypothetical protein